MSMNKSSLTPSSANNPPTVSNQCLYFITTGYFVGETWYYGEKKGDTHYFLCVNKKEIREVSEEKLAVGLSEKILDASEPLDDKVLLLLSEQYRYNIKAKQIQNLQQKFTQTEELEETFPTDYNDNEENDN